MLKNNMTPCQDINEVLAYISCGTQDILDKNTLIGLYLFGSLTYGDFNVDTSDIDLVAIISKPLNNHELELIKQLHKQVDEKYPKWNHRLECSYTPIDMLKNTLPPKAPRPYYGGGVFYEEAPYGNEWLINNYLLYKYGIQLKLIGPGFKELINPIDFIEVQKACVRDLFQEWESNITDFEWLDNSHYQAYLVLNLCRILYTVICGETATKKVSAEWVKNQYGLPWISLIETAQSWKYGKEMLMKSETIDFIKFVINKITQTTLYQQMCTNKII